MICRSWAGVVTLGLPVRGLSLTECVWLYRLARFEIAGCEHPRRRATVRCPSPASNMPIARRRCSLDRRGILFFFCDFLYCFYSSLQFNSWNHSISSVQSTVSLIRWLSAYASVIVTQACHGQGWMIEWLKRNQKHLVNVHHLYTLFFSKINVL